MKPAPQAKMQRERMTIWDPEKSQNISPVNVGSSFITKKMMRMIIPPTRHNSPRNSPEDEDLIKYISRNIKHLIWWESPYNMNMAKLPLNIKTFSYYGALKKLNLKVEL